MNRNAIDVTIFRQNVYAGSDENLFVEQTHTYTHSTDNAAKSISPTGFKLFAVCHTMCRV